MPKGIRFHRYLPNGVLKVVKNDEASSSLMCQSPFFTSSFEKTFAPCSRVLTSSIVGRGKCFLRTALLRFFGSKQILSCPFGFTTSTIELIQSVGVVTSARMSCSSNCSSLRLTWSLNATGTRRGAYWRGCTSGFKRMLYSPGIWPMRGPNPFGNFFIRLSADRGSSVSSWNILVFSHSTCLPFISSVPRYLMIFKCMQDFRPEWSDIVTINHLTLNSALQFTSGHCQSGHSNDWHFGSTICDQMCFLCLKVLQKMVSMQWHLCRFSQVEHCMRSCIWLKPDGTSGWLQFQGHQLSVVQQVCSLSTGCIDVHRQWNHCIRFSLIDSVCLRSLPPCCPCSCTANPAFACKMISHPTGVANFPKRGAPLLPIAEYMAQTTELAFSAASLVIVHCPRSTLLPNCSLRRSCVWYCVRKTHDTHLCAHAFRSMADFICFLQCEICFSLKAFSHPVVRDPKH